ncbi:outer membrane beta-barrel protein [Flavobacterium terrigena]|uniref:Opacity protein n=1 Tax=Flavobacterium terrigena TaxID=402734 RepID=A0A1H6XW17_9FLAO|nr:outer membrane beta-barrel protein [Flavobacterium terrigena]SEJ32376.1 Opacity protein [Flavobacterium terrigena]
MKKVLLSAVAVLAFTLGNAQSNQKGTMHVNVMGGFLSGTSTSQADEAGSLEYKSTANGAQFGANFQYGIAESFSAGIGLEVGTAVLTPKNLDSYDSYGYTEPSISTFKVIASGRYYFLNEEKFNVYAGPSVGFTTGKDKVVAYAGDSKTKYSGLNYGINAGGNYFFTDIVGITANVGYEGNSLKSKQTFDGEEFTGKATLSGIKVMFGLALKF